MTNNKKSQILAAVMCASSIIGSYTAVSAANVVNDNNANVISATTELDETISFGGAVDDITINTIKNRGGSFEVDAKGNLVATSVVSNGDVRSDKYSLNTIGANTAGITSTGGSTTIQGVSFANGRMQATQAKIGGVEIKDGHVDGVKIGQLRDAVANNIVNTEGLTKNVDELKQKTANISSIGNTTVVDKNLQVQGQFTAAGGNLRVDTDGSLKTKGDVVTLNDDGRTEKYSLNKIGEKTSNISLIGNTTVVDKNLFVQGQFTAAGGLLRVDEKGNVISEGSMTANDFTTKEGKTLNTVAKQLEDLSGNVGESSKKIEGIERDETTKTTTIEGSTSINKDGIKVGNSVEINANGSMSARNGDAYFNFDKNNVGLSNGNNILSIGNKNITINAAGTAMVLNHNGLDYADGAFKVRNDGTVTANGSITADDFITKEGNTLDTVAKQLKDLSGNIGESSKNIAGIEREGDKEHGFTTSIETTFKIHSPGVDHNVGTIDIYGDMIQSTGANGQKTIITGNGIITNDLTVGGVHFGDLVNRVEDLENKTQNITPSKPGNGEGGNGESGNVPPTTDGHTGINGDLTVGGNIKADSATIGNTTINKDGITTDKITVGQTSVTNDGVTVGDVKGEHTSITKGDVTVTDSQGHETSLKDVGNRVTGLESSMSSMNSRINNVEERIDKVGAMSAAIANLRTMGYDPEAPTEIAIGVGQYKSETGVALGIFHYPNQDFMFSASISTSGDEVMGGIGATWKLGRKSASEKALDAKNEEARHLEKAEEMKKLAQESKVKAQAERHAKLLAEREAQKKA